LIVQTGALCALNRIEEWSTSSASSDREGNNSTYGAGSTDHQFRASNCTHDNPYKKDFERLYEVIASLLPNKAHHAFQAGKYTEGHFIDAHDDAAYLDVCCKSATSSSGGKATILCSRDVAMVYYLTKDWTSANGGCFVDLAGGEIVCPEFNTCILFHVPRLHRVEPVLLGHVRYSIFGWFYEKGRLYELDHYEEENDKSNQSKIKDKNAKKKKKLRIQRKP
jgi:2OG-Fe(II) oxygenase superfamily